jgi:hypothetical protein
MKDRRIDIRLTNYELRQLEEEANRRAMSKSELLRGLIARFPAPSFKVDSHSTCPFIPGLKTRGFQDCPL